MEEVCTAYDNEIVKYLISLKGKEVELEEIKKEHKKEIKWLKKKIDKYSIEQPKTTRSKTELKLKLCDDYTKWVIVDYLKTDIFELVKNIAWVTNSDNAWNVISHMDWWLARNYALIELLEKSINKKKEFDDKIKWLSKKRKDK